MKLIDSLVTQAAGIAQVRRDLHAHPELCFHEVRTADVVAAKLTEWGIPIHRGLGTTGSVYEATFGLDIKPLASNKNFATLHIRPEIRYDYSNESFFAGGTKHDQWTAAVDAVFGF